MIAVEADLFLNDFEVEARAHIERIEAFFLDVESLAVDSDMMNSVFRIAHSLKGTAGFFSLRKIVAIAHELESVFSQIKDGKLSISDEITDVVLKSVDCLRALVDDIRDDEAIDTAEIIETLRKYSNSAISENSSGGDAEEIDIPFDCKDPDTEEALRYAVKHGQKIYYLNIGFNRGLGKYYKHPEGLFDSIQSIGAIAEAIVNGNEDDIIRDRDPAALTERIMSALSGHDTATLELLVTSVLELELFAIAIELNRKNVFLIPKETVFGVKSDGGDEIAKAVTESKDDAGPPKAVAEQPQKSDQSRGNNFLIHLDITVINSLLDLANEMVLVRNQLISAASVYEKSDTGLMPIVNDIGRLTSEIQESVMLTRMQPVSVVFSKFPRIIRDTAKSLHKDIEIEILGSDVALDKYLLDALADPITQLVKNSADHGIEPADIRAGLGKQPKGKITLNAFMRDGSAIIEVTDDGAGIDTEVVKNKALERGIVTEDMLSVMTDNDVFALILEPGFSTAQKVTSLSGRGVGMDIVKTNIEKLGGSVEIESVIEKGTTIRLRTPLTLSVVRVLIVDIDSIRYAVPEINVDRIVRIERDTQAKRLERVNDSLVLVLDRRVIPVVTMDEIVAKAKGLEAPSSAALLEKCLRRSINKCLVLKAGERVYALLIDDAKDSEQTLVKPLPAFLKNCLCYSNVTVLGNGSAITILDAEGILRLTGVKGVENEPFDPEGESEDKTTEKQYIIFKCSGSEYYALETGEISRIEIIDTNDIQRVGNGNYINIAGESVRVIRPENYVPVTNHRYNEEKLYLITIKKCASPMGFLAGKLLDKVEKAFVYEENQLYSDFIFGTSTFNEKVLIFLNQAAIVSEVELDKQRRKKVKKAGAAV